MGPRLNIRSVSGAGADTPVDNPAQMIWDCVTLTCIAEDLSGGAAIVLEDGELYNRGDYCGTKAECITGVHAFEHEANMIGHTARFSSEGPPDPELVAHELQHVYDTENLGGIPFVAAYSAAGGIGWISGGDPTGAPTSRTALITTTKVMAPTPRTAPEGSFRTYCSADTDEQLRWTSPYDDFQWRRPHRQVGLHHSGSAPSNRHERSQLPTKHAAARQIYRLLAPHRGDHGDAGRLHGRLSAYILYNEPMPGEY